MAAAAKQKAPFLGASANWVDDDEATYEHVKRQVADYLRERLQARTAALDRSELTTNEIVVELKRQMAECAVDGDLVLAADLGEATWSLLQYRESEGAL
jgi:hypothetical protein